MIKYKKIISHLKEIKMKKLFAIIIAASLLLTACGSETKDNQSSNESDVVSSSSSENEKAKLNIGEFKAQTVYGEEVTNEVFADYDITMINIWATWCGPCIKEIPDLGELYNNLPENFNLITICTDAKGQEEAVKSFLEEKEAKMPVLIPDEKIEEFLNKNINAYPTSLFVDKDGNIIGKALQGAPRDDVAETYLKIMNERADTLNK